MITHLSPSRVVVVGGGASGTLAAVRLLTATRPPREVVLVERAPRVARGVAYATERPEHVLNVPAGGMSAWPERPGDFVAWLSRRDSAFADPAAFVPRGLYAHYLHETLAAAVRDADGRARFRRIAGEAVAVSTTGAALRVRLADGETLGADRVVLALGPPAAASAFPDVPGAPLLADPWRPGALDAIPATGDVFVLGTGLTMVDVALTLARKGRTIHALSRHGWTPRPHATGRRAWAFDAEDGRHGALGLRALVRSARREASRAEANGAAWTDVMDALRPHGSRLWLRLGEADRRRFLRHVRPVWDVHRHRMAPSVAARFEAAKARRLVRVYAGRLRGIAADRGGLRVDWTPRRGGEGASFRVAAAVAAAGPALDARERAPDVVRSLVSEGRVRFDALGLGLDATPEGVLLDASGRPDARLVGLGPVLRGVLWETTAIPEIREQARRLAELPLPGSAPSAG